MPAPGLDAFDHGVVEHNRDVALIDIQLGAAFRLEFLLGEIVRDERKVLAWNAIALGRIAVTPVGKTDASHAAGDDDDIAADLFAEILLKNTAIVDFNAFDQLVPPTRGNLGNLGTVRGRKSVTDSIFCNPSKFGSGPDLRPRLSPNFPPNFPRRPKSLGSIERICSSMAWRASTASPAWIASTMRRCEASERGARSGV